MWSDAVKNIVKGISEAFFSVISLWLKDHEAKQEAIRLAMREQELVELKDTLKEADNEKHRMQVNGDLTDEQLSDKLRDVRAAILQRRTLTNSKNK